MRVLVIGGGAREHVICWKAKLSPLVDELYAAPGNAGIESVATCVNIPVTDSEALLQFALEKGIDLTIVGPERPLSMGIVDRFEQKGLKIVGPVEAAARMESSKSFAKDVMTSAGVDTAEAVTVSSLDQGLLHLAKVGAPIVIKADGLAEGKGVVVAMTAEEARGALEEFLVGGKHGDAGRTVVLEEFMRGEEASAIALVDGLTVKPLAFASDYKRVYDGNKGPNTGGMGTISPTPILPDALAGKVVQEVFEPLLQELLRRGIHYRGFLYAGLMVEPSGRIRVVEFNARLGDPETQVILTRMESDLITHLLALVEGRLDQEEISWSEDSSMCVVACSRGYPDTVDDGYSISGLEREQPHTFVFQAGTRRNPGDSQGVWSKGGRILSVVGVGKSLSEAGDRAYTRIKNVCFEGMHYRTDIGTRFPAS